jgi:hypothetical protein
VALDVTSLAQPLAEVRKAELFRTRQIPEKADPIDLPRLLPIGNERARRLSTRKTASPITCMAPR